MSFFRLDKPVQFLKGAGPVRSEALGRIGIVTTRDLLYHVPRRYDDASTIEPIARLQGGADVTHAGPFGEFEVDELSSGEVSGTGKQLDFEFHEMTSSRFERRRGEPLGSGSLSAISGIRP